MKFRLAIAATTVTMMLATMMLVFSSGPAGAGTYDDPFFLNWPSFVPAAESGDFTASTEKDCPTGSLHCVDKVIREMTLRYNRLGCDHNSMFAFTYLLTTEEYRSAVEDPDFFTDNGFVNHQDVVFADYYFEAHDDWNRGRVDQVPPAWRIAFHAADNQDVSGIGNVLLGMNAHVNRDLPFVLEAIGLVKPDGTSRKADHDRVNDFLNEVNKYLLTDAARYLDPSVDDGDVPGTSLDNSTMVHLLTGWRERAWRNAERLAGASTDAERAKIAQEIENTAAFEALLLRDTFEYDLLGLGLWGSSGAAERNTFCGANFEPR